VGIFFSNLRFILNRMDSEGVMEMVRTCCAGVLAGLVMAQGVAAQVAAGSPLPVQAASAQSARAAAADPDTIKLAEIRVVGSPAEMSRIPGSATLISPIALESWRTVTMNEALRRVPGLTVREEEGLGLRPNIGLRGLSPTRSSKVLLLEDGIPVVFSPYGDNAAYYHPPISRFDRIEVLRGSGQIAFGPQTVGGVINYLTPAVPTTSAGRLSLMGGSRGFLDLNGRAGTTVGRFGGLTTFSHRQAEGARENTASAVSDGTAKATARFGDRHALTVRGNYYRERSNVTYSGLTEAEWRANARQNPFVNDSMKLDRWGASATHRLTLSPFASITTTAYASDVDRHWWRQSSNSAQRPNDAADPNCGGMANLLTTCGNEGRLRAYQHYGVEPRLRMLYTFLGRPSELEAGARWHGEVQDRQQVNGASPLARVAGPAEDRNAGLREDNLRKNAALSAFAQQRMMLGHLSVTPGVRVEHITYERTNRLTDVRGTAELTQVIPGLGMTYELRPGLLLFGGAHRGFAPPRTEDVIDNSSGTVVELDAELSWSYEAGFRGHAGPFNLEVTAFRMDFENQIIPASVAGGTGAALTNSGRTLHQGAELGLRFDAGQVVGRTGPYVDGALTWLPVARFEGERFAWISTSGSDQGKVYAAQNAGGTRQQVSVVGNRLPYAPEATYTVGMGWQEENGLDLRLERHGVSSQFGDAVNTRVTVADGQQGVLEAWGTWNLSASHRLSRTGTRAFLSVRNATNELYLVDRTRGMIPGNPRTFQLGVRQEFR
jgi:Fe(3+) dicitrate transport protein